MLLFSAIIIGLVCFLLVVVVLAQNSKGGGLAMGMGAVQTIGTRHATDLLEKSTWVLSAILIAACLGLNAYVTSTPADASQGDEILFEAPVTPPPAQDGGAQEGGSQEGGAQEGGSQEGQ